MVQGNITLTRGHYFYVFSWILLSYQFHLWLWLLNWGLIIAYMLSVILINVRTIAFLWGWLSLHVQNDPIHHLRDPHPDLWHVLWITYVACVQIWFKISENSNQSVSKRKELCFYVWALIKFIGSPTSVPVFPSLKFFAAIAVLYKSWCLLVMEALKK